MTTDARVRIHVVAGSPQMQLLRAVAGHLCAVEEFTVDEIDDVKMLVEEAAILLASASSPDLEISADLSVVGSVFKARLQVPASKSLDRESYAWVILEALAENLEVFEDSSQIDVSFSKGTALESKGL